MKTVLISLCPALILLLSASYWIRSFELSEASLSDLPIPVCGAVSPGKVVRSAQGRYVGALPGWGSHSYPVATDSDSAQYFFNQGLSLYYGYHFKEALASFKESARFDPDNAMAYWGQALAMGPYYNAAHLYAKPAELGEVLVKMNRKAVKCPPNELKLIGAMNQRYSDDPEDKQRAELNTAYAQAMRKLTDIDDEAMILYVDAVMLIHPWDFWLPDGTAQPWTHELIQFTETVLKRNPDHPAALHYHIHLTEASRHPEVALESGHRLKDLMPGIPHMVHMSSHEYERNGLYALGVKVNTLADSNLRVYNDYANHLNLNTFSSHYFAVQTYCALTGGMFAQAGRFALQTRSSTSPSAKATYEQYLFMLPALVKVRAGKWQEILNDDTKIPEAWSHAGLLADFARGVAAINTGNLTLAETSLAGLRIKIQDPLLENRRIPFNAPVQSARIAEKLLEGMVLYAQKNTQKALASLEEAVNLESQLIYTEPKDWPIPSRQVLGAYLLKEGLAERAAAVYQEDLIKNPANGWSLTGLQKSLRAAGKPVEADQLIPRIEEAFAAADQLPEDSIFME